MSIMKLTTSSFVLAALLLLATTVNSAFGAAGVIAYFQKQGAITSISKNLSSIVIEDKTYSLTTNTKVYSLAGRPLSLDDLRRGLAIRFNVEAGQETVIREILLIPSN